MEKHSATGTRTRVARVRAEYPNQLDYSGVVILVDRHSRLDFKGHGPVTATSQTCLSDQIPNASAESTDPQLPDLEAVAGNSDTAYPTNLDQLTAFIK